MIGAYLAEHGGGCVIVVLGYILMIGGPFALLALFVMFLRDRSLGPRRGLAFGLSVAIWASLSELLVPYCGLYASLPGVMLAQRLGVETVWQQEAVVHAVNFTLWPMLGWFLFFAVGQGRAAGASQQAGREQ